MAQRRMFSLKIVDTDAFLDMPPTTQNLYFHLCMRADDDGFVSSPKKIMKIVNSGDDDMKLLFTKKFVIPFKSGICVIKHWKIHNYIQKDRYAETNYLEEKAELSEKKNGVYTMDTKCIQNGYSGKSKSKVREGKVILTSSKNDDVVNKIFDLFYKTINPTINFGNKTNRKSCQELIDRFGFDVVERMTALICEAQQKGDQFCPVATTPYQMKEKLAQFKIYFNNKKNGKPTYKKI